MTGIEYFSLREIVLDLSSAHPKHRICLHSPLGARGLCLVFVDTDLVVGRNSLCYARNVVTGATYMTSENEARRLMAVRDVELVTAAEAMRITGIANTASLYRRIKAGNFPKPVKLGKRTTRFVKSECHEFVRSLIAERDKENGR